MTRIAVAMLLFFKLPSLLTVMLLFVVRCESRVDRSPEVVGCEVGCLVCPVAISSEIILS